MELGDCPGHQSQGAPIGAAQLGRGVGQSHKWLVLCGEGAGTGGGRLLPLCALPGKHGGRGGMCLPGLCVG